MKSMLRMMVGLVVLCLATTASAQLFKPLAKPILPNASAPGVGQQVTIPQDMGQVSALKVLNIYPGLECVMTPQVIQDNNGIVGQIEMGERLGVDFKTFQSGSWVAELGYYRFLCPARVPSGSVIKKLQVVGSLEAKDAPERSIRFQVGQISPLDQGMKVGTPRLELSIKDQGFFNAVVQGDLSVDASGPVIVEIFGIDPITPKPQGLKYDVKLIKVFYE